MLALGPQRLGGHSKLSFWMNTVMPQGRIPNAVAMVVGEVLGTHYYHHSTLETLFSEKGCAGRSARRQLCAEVPALA
jgi:hypothetical protein